MYPRLSAATVSDIALNDGASAIIAVYYNKGPIWSIEHTRCDCK